MASLLESDFFELGSLGVLARLARDRVGEIPKDTPENNLTVYGERLVEGVLEESADYFKRELDARGLSRISVQVSYNGFSKKGILVDVEQYLEAVFHEGR